MEEFCPTCGAKMKAYWVSLTPGLISALVKFREAVKYKKMNKVHLLKDMNGKPFELTRHEWNNFTRLRFHGLAVKTKNDPGYWLLTKRGNDFLKGEIKVPSKVKIFRNKIVDRSADQVSIREVLGSVPYFEAIDDIKYEAVIPEEAILPEKEIKKKGHWDFSTGKGVWIE